MKAKEYADKFIHDYKHSQLNGEMAVRYCASKIFDAMYEEYSAMYHVRCRDITRNYYTTVKEVSDKWGAMCRLIKKKINVDVPEDLFICTIKNNHMLGWDSIVGHYELRDHGFLREESATNLGSSSDLLRIRDAK